MNHDAAVPLVRRFARTFPLKQDEIDAINTAVSQVREVDKDQDLLRSGDKPGICNLLLEGVVCRYDSTAEGARQILSFHFAGEVYDSQSYLLNVMDHSISTITRCTIAIIPHEAMRALVTQNPRVAHAIWKDTLIDAAIFRKWMLGIGRKSALQRVAHLMCENFTRLELVDLARGDTVDWPFTQAEIGDALGLSLVHVNRMFQELRGSGLITLAGQRLTIHDREGLADLGEFDPCYLHSEPPAVAGELP